MISGVSLVNFIDMMNIFLVETSSGLHFV